MFLKMKVWSNLGLRFFLCTLVSYFGFLSGNKYNLTKGSVKPVDQSVGGSSAHSMTWKIGKVFREINLQSTTKITTKHSKRVERKALPNPKLLKSYLARLTIETFLENISSMTSFRKKHHQLEIRYEERVPEV